MTRAAEAAAILWDHWRRGARIDALPASCRPATRAEGYAVQAEIGRLTGFVAAGWKIAATSLAGQQHINVDGPLAGRLYADRRLTSGTPVSLAGNVMNVAEPEFAFRIAAALPRRASAYTVDEVLAATASLHPAIEVPDSRYVDFTAVGAAQLIADTACACWFLIGHAAPASWRDVDLARHAVHAYRNGEPAGDGGGFNVLGDPRVALAWLANELAQYGPGLQPGDVVITGTCVKPVAVMPGDTVAMDFGALGSIAASFVS
ncbi:MAG: fumarylacetoacetate hydrolase family protein [Acidobacteria bacterium]|nr:fumarylacetoacetate hydrolase family protein [Acidobacteriota bacterium]